MKRQATGVLGEKLAASFLRKRDYQILETNYRCPYGEIDIVASQGDYLVFVEVRTRHGSEYGRPEESVTPVKMRRLRNSAAHYLQSHEGASSDWRIDMVAIELGKDDRPMRIELVENAVCE